MVTGIITKVSGPLVVADQMEYARMNDVVRVGELKLIGEIIELHGSRAFIQVYEETAGIGPGEPVVSLEQPLSVTLGPGLIGSIYDGIQRPLNDLKVKFGNFITRGVTAPRLNHQKKWSFNPQVKNGQMVKAGDVIGVVPETGIISHKIMIPLSIKEAKILSVVDEGLYTIDDVIAEVETDSGKNQT